MSNADSRGTFVWHDLLTADAAGAKAFYTKVVPWKTQTWDQDASYTMWVGRNGPVGGIGPLGDAGSPRWMPHVSVPDVVATADEAKNLGGRVLKEPTSLPNGGKFAVLADPQGAEFSVYQSATESNGAAAPGVGDFTWHELATSDATAAMEFYTALFGWEAGPVHDMGPAGLYHLFLHNGNQYGGIYVSSNWGGPSWLCYIGVEDAGKAVVAAKAAGGRVLNGPTEVPGGSWVAQVLDSDGAPFAVHEPAKVVSAPAASASEPPPAKQPKPAKPKAPKPEKVVAADVEPVAEPAREAAVAAKPAAKKSAAAKQAAAKPATAKPAAKSAASKRTAPAVKGKSKTAKKAAKKAATKGKAKAAVKKSAAGKSQGMNKGMNKGKKKAAGKKKSAAKRAAPARKTGKTGKAGKKAAKKTQAKSKAKKRR